MSVTLDYLQEPIAHWLGDPAVEDVLVNAPDNIWTFERGIYQRQDAKIDATSIENMAIVAAAQLRQDVHHDRPLLSIAMNKEGEAARRLQAVFYPCVPSDRPCLVIRRGSSDWPSMKDLAAKGLFKKAVAKRVVRRDEELLKLYNDGQFDEFITLAVKRRRTIIACGQTASGKAQPLDSQVLTPTGFRAMRDIKAGSLVLTADGAVVPVTAIYPQGEVEIYRVTFSDGRSVECCGDHLWKIWHHKPVYETGKSHATRRCISGASWQIYRTTDIRRWFTENRRAAKRAAVPLIEPAAIELPPKDLPIDPYALGALIGDGHLASNVSFSTADEHILESVLAGIKHYRAVYKGGYDYQLCLVHGAANEFRSMGATERDERQPHVFQTKPGRGGANYQIEYDGIIDTLNGWARRIGIWPGCLRRRLFLWKWPLAQALNGADRLKFKARRSPLQVSLTRLGLYGARSYNKFVPGIYKTGSVEQRRAILQGLMDTEGSVGSCEMSASFSTVSERLARDVQELSWSLGAIASISNRQTYYRDEFGNKRPGRPSFRVSIMHPDISSFFTLPRKLTRCREKTTRMRLRITSIEPVGRKPAQCITVAHPSGLYVTDNYVVTHNTTLSKAMIGEIPLEDRLIVIEDAQELLDLPHQNSVALFCKKDPKEGDITATQLVDAALRMRIGRLFMQEIRDGNAANAFLIALQTGHTGAITTIHANDCAGVFNRLRVLISQTPEGRGVRPEDVTEQLQAFIDVVIHLTLDEDGERHVDEVWFKDAHLG